MLKHSSLEIKESEKVNPSTVLRNNDIKHNHTERKFDGSLALYHSKTDLKETY